MIVITQPFVRRAAFFRWVAYAACLVASASAASAPVSHLAQSPSRVEATDTLRNDPQFVARITAQLAAKGRVRAQFRQTQVLAALAAPLVSTGTLVFARAHGVIWRTDTPYRVTYVIGETSITKIDASGHRSTRSSARGGMAQASRMMRAMLGGDLSALYSQFDVAAGGTPAKWRMLLTPNQPQLAQFIKSLRMEGGAFLKTLAITAANGDTTRIEFSGSETIDALSPGESALFGAR